MKPVLIQFYGFEIYSYGLMLAIAFLTGIFGVRFLIRQKGLDVSFDAVVDLAVWVLVGAIVGARLAYIITDFRYFLIFPGEIFKINSGGLAFHGGLIGGFGAGYWFTRVKRIPTWQLADLVAPMIAFGYALVRVGCLLNGCCYGKTSALPWALRCASNDSLLRHPTQLYSLIGSLILAVILFKLRNHKQFPGFLFLLYIGLYSILRFGVEFFREGPMIFPWLSLAQGVCLLLGILAFTLIWWQRARFKKGRMNQDAVSEIHR
ncbi:MAG TPA: prolipoprotein diacylglyceryl transferase [Bacillota bacterium]|nr:prolipoprotein diacylglyceryl transferase [Bacillota bacterium]HPT87827.1 prolipoprotein diacylglyceryl transferase [Bacillota bacterium]